MAIPFSGLFEKVKARFRPTAPTATVRALPVEKPSSERLSKTVRPNATRTVAPVDPFEVAAGTKSSGRAGLADARSTSKAAGLPPAVAVALEPKIERTITLQLSDVVSHIPSDYLKPADTFDTSRAILLKASEIEKGMAIGKPAASLTAIYEQVPEIFQRSVPQNEVMQVPLPMQKVLEQFANARVRDDQERDQVVPQVNTPILQATIEDTQKFGTSIAPIETSSMPPVKVEPASAKALADAEPEMLRETAPAPAPPARSTIRLTIPLEPEAKTPSPPPNEPPKPTKISIELPPKGTGAPAPERVPASSGPSVPIRPKLPTPPLKVTAPCADLLRPKLTLVPGVENVRPVAQEEQHFAPPLRPKKQSDEPTISLPLRPILQMMAPFQLNGTPDVVPDDARVEFPLSLIQPQLAVGRVVVSPKQFQAAMPRQFRELIVIDTSETPVQLPLQEVLKNIPHETLKVRGDQEEAERGEDFETPFSIKAKEDAEKFKIGAAPVAKAQPPPPNEPPKETPAAEKIDNEKIDNVKIDKVAPAEAPPTLDAKEAVARASELDGVAGCVVTFADGLSLAGNLPDDMAVGGLCAMAPSLLQRIHHHMFETNLGPLNAMTLHGDKSAITFFSQDNVYLTVLHGRTQLRDQTYEKLASLTKELARTYAPQGKD